MPPGCLSMAEEWSRSARSRSEPVWAKAGIASNRLTSPQTVMCTVGHPLFLLRHLGLLLPLGSRVSCWRSRNKGCPTVHITVWGDVSRFDAIPALAQTG